MLIFPRAYLAVVLRLVKTSLELSLSHWCNPKSVISLAHDENKDLQKNSDQNLASTNRVDRRRQLSEALAQQQKCTPGLEIKVCFFRLSFN